MHAHFNTIGFPKYCYINYMYLLGCHQERCAPSPTDANLSIMCVLSVDCIEGFFVLQSMES